MCRRKAQLDEISTQDDKITGVVFDPNGLAAIGAFAQEMVSKGVDYLILNAECNTRFDFSKVGIWSCVLS
jgi:hypothetical protein